VAALQLALRDGEASEVGRRQEALAPAEEAVGLYRTLAADNPAFLPDLARALDNLGVSYREVGRTEEIDALWRDILAEFPEPADRAFLLPRRAGSRAPGEPSAAGDLLEE